MAGTLHPVRVIGVGPYAMTRTSPRWDRQHLDAASESEGPHVASSLFSGMT